MRKKVYWETTSERFCGKFDWLFSYISWIFTLRWVEKAKWSLILPPYVQNSEIHLISWKIFYSSVSILTHMHNSVLPSQMRTLEVSNLQNIVQGKWQDNTSFMVLLCAYLCNWKYIIEAFRENVSWSKHVTLKKFWKHLQEKTKHNSNF